MNIYPWCGLLLLGFAVWYALWFPPVRRPAAIAYPRDGGRVFVNN